MAIRISFCILRRKGEYVSVCVCVCVCVSECVSVCVCTYACMYVCTYACMYVCMRVCILWECFYCLVNLSYCYTMPLHFWSSHSHNLSLSPFKHTHNSNNFVYDIFFWLGKDTSQDEAGVAAFKTVELDEGLGGGPVQYREVSVSESVSELLTYSWRKGGKEGRCVYVYS